MKEIAPILERLADSLGVSVNQLWDVLLSQAHISAATDCIQYALIAAGIYFWLKVTTVTTAKIRNNDIVEENLVWVIFVWLILAGLGIESFFAVAHTITKIFNPDYWALSQIMDVIAKRH